MFDEILHQLIRMMRKDVYNTMSSQDWAEQAERMLDDALVKMAKDYGQEDDLS